MWPTLLLNSLQSPNVKLEEDELEFTALGVGAKGRNEYHFVLEFYLPVNPKVSLLKITS